MSNAIVVLNVSQTQAPAPNTLQQTGALISQGGTTKAPNTLTLVSTLAQLVSILSAGVSLTSLVYNAGTVTATTSVPHGWAVGDTPVSMTISGASPAGYNGSFVATITGTSTFTYPLGSNPGSETVPGTAVLGSESELLAMGTTYFSGNGNPAIYVLELGEGTPNEGVAALSTWLSNNPQTVYSFLVPYEWDNNANFLTFLNTQTAPNAKVYFMVTTILANRAVYAGLKCVLAAVETPNNPASEFSLASTLGTTLGYNPGSTNRVTPLSYAYAYGVTPYPQAGNQTTFTQLNTANVGYFAVASEAGLSNVITFYGQMQDGNPFNYWYSADWVQINLDLNLSNEIVNGSNNPLAPLYYDQNGINRLQNRAAQVLAQAVTNGLAVGTVLKTSLPASVFAANYEAGLYEGFLVINAEPFITYSQENPNDYAIGKYAGLACVYTPSRGFKQIFFNLNVTNFIA